MPCVCVTSSAELSSELTPTDKKYISQPQQVCAYRTPKHHNPQPPPLISRQTVLSAASSTEGHGAEFCGCWLEQQSKCSLRQWVQQQAGPPPPQQAHSKLRLTDTDTQTLQVAAKQLQPRRNSSPDCHTQATQRVSKRFGIQASCHKPCSKQKRLEQLCKGSKCKKEHTLSPDQAQSALDTVVKCLLCVPGMQHLGCDMNTHTTTSCSQCHTCHQTTASGTGLLRRMPTVRL